mmetsp:Transcript_2230/g.2970  ORF Transcript_2230/g.2970 Transcript_2230/m.2970 type:complete len:104 (-) Transcript_2230:1454-1765(-)
MVSTVFHNRRSYTSDGGFNFRCTFSFAEIYATKLSVYTLILMHNNRICMCDETLSVVACLLSGLGAGVGTAVRPGLGTGLGVMIAPMFTPLVIFSLHKTLSLG